MRIVNPVAVETPASGNASTMGPPPRTAAPVEWRQTDWSYEMSCVCCARQSLRNGTSCTDPLEPKGSWQGFRHLVLNFSHCRTLSWFFPLRVRKYSIYFDFKGAHNWFWTLTEIPEFQKGWVFLETRYFREAWCFKETELLKCLNFKDHGLLKLLS